MLLRNARVLGNAHPVDVAIDGGIIASVTPAADAIARTGETSGGEWDVAGRWVIPGLWDNHVHFSQWTLSSQRLSVMEATSAAEAARLIARALAADIASSRTAPLDATVPYVVSGFRDGLWPDSPNIADLDDASTTHPIVVVSADLHAVWLNSAALTLYGLAGHPTGLLREDAAFEITRRVDSVPDAALDAWASAAGSAAAARGVVGIVELEMTWNLETWKRRMASGFDVLRVEFGIYTEHLERAIALGLRSGDAINDLLTVGRYKVLADGSLNTRTAWTYNEYPGLEGTEQAHGQLTVSKDRLVPLMRRAAEAGITPDVHAIGDLANSMVLDAFAEVGGGGRIEHAQLLAAADLPRFAQLGVEASVQPDHAMDDRDVADHYWSGHTDRAFPLRSLLDNGATLALGSDAPVSPLDPWRTIAAAVGRRRDGRKPWHPEQAITVEEAIDASTRTRVAAGQRADLVVTEIDPYSATPETLFGMPVAATVLGGRFTHTTL